jgi:cyclic-di-GMP-binding protein
MAKDFSFDVVSDFDAGEMTNAIDQAQREVSTRYDFKGTGAVIEFSDGKNGLELTGDSRNQLLSLIDVIQSKLIKRQISPKVLDTSSEPRESGLLVKQSLPFKRGLDQEKAKKLTKLIRDSFPKAKAQIQGDSVRVSSTSKDDLQGIMSLLKQQDLDFPLEFQNLR